MAAVASFLEARTRGGRWYVRVEDIDPPREVPGATAAILKAMEAYGLEWDGPVLYQSDSRKSHEAALNKLIADGAVYRCGCSRRELGAVYPGTCRAGSQANEAALRVITNNDEIAFVDGLQGPRSQRLESESGDFVVLRKDGLIAYQLAVVVDDHLQGVTDIVRGIDLLDSTARQIWLQRLLEYQTPNYVHIPVAVNDDGQKLSKSHGASGVPLERVPHTLCSVFEALAQEPPKELANGTVTQIWQWAVGNWDIAALTGQAQLPVGIPPSQPKMTNSDKSP